MKWESSVIDLGIWDTNPKVQPCVKSPLWTPSLLASFPISCSCYPNHGWTWSSHELLQCTRTSPALFLPINHLVFLQRSPVNLTQTTDLFLPGLTNWRWRCTSKRLEVLLIRPNKKRSLRRLTRPTVFWSADRTLFSTSLPILFGAAPCVASCVVDHDREREVDE